jgi:tetratricopeptide (TPR) repeat protein
MTSAHDCKRLQEQLFDYRRAELSALDAAQFEAEMAGCPACAQRAARLIGLLDRAEQASAEVWLDAEDAVSAADKLDALFNSISQRLEDISPTPQDEETRSKVRLEGQLAALTASANDDDEQAAPPARRTMLWLVAAAACALIAGAAYMATRPDLTAPQPELSVAATPAPAAPVLQEAELAALAPAESDADGVRIFASEGAVWRMDQAEQAHVVRLSGGTLLIEFLPSAQRRSLRVITPQAEVEVVGTVFFVRAQAKPQQEAVGVLAGAVRVRRAGASDAKLVKRGEAIEADGDVRELDAKVAEQAAPMIDLVAHEAALAALAEAVQPQPVEVGSPSDPPALEPAPKDKPAKLRPSPQPRVETDAALRQRASDALASRQYAQAVSAYEQLLKRAPRGSAEAATLRLELARLYMRELNQREAAARHLRAFIADHPNDVAAPSARRQLCRLDGREGAQCAHQ